MRLGLGVDEDRDEDEGKGKFQDDGIQLMEIHFAILPYF